MAENRPQNKRSTVGERCNPSEGLGGGIFFIKKHAEEDYQFLCSYKGRTRGHELYCGCLEKLTRKPGKPVLCVPLWKKKGEIERNTSRGSTKGGPPRERLLLKNLRGKRTVDLGILRFP